MLCPTCDGEMRPWLDMPIDAKKDLPTPHRTIARCSGCGLGAVDPSPDADEIAAFYDLGSYYTHGQSHIRPVDPQLIDKILVRLAWAADRARPVDVDDIAARLPRGGSVLDLGCGDAELLAQFSDRGFSVIGVDPDGRSRAQAASRGVDVLEGTAEHPPAALLDRRFDLVVMAHSLEHCRDVSLALRNVARLMLPGGIAYIEVPNAGCIHFDTFRQCSEMFDSPRHLWFFTADALARAAEAAGLSIGEWRYHGYTRHFMASWRAWEGEIFERLRKRGSAGGAVKHSLARSFDLLRRSAFAGFRRKYDSIGILAELRTVAQPVEAPPAQLASRSAAPRPVPA